MTWHDRAACRPDARPAAVTFDDFVAETDAAAAICATCPVAHPCLTEAIATGAPFMRAGLRAKDRPAAALDHPGSNRRWHHGCRCAGCIDAHERKLARQQKLRAGALAP